jgi:hypothetical protein
MTGAIGPEQVPLLDVDRRSIIGKRWLTTQEPGALDF